MTEQHNIDLLFKSQLDAFESPVNPQVWSTVQAAIPQTVVTTVTTSATVFTVKSLIIVASLLVASTCAYFYFNDNEGDNKKVAANTEKISKPDSPTQTEEHAINEITVFKNETPEKTLSGQSNTSAIEPIEDKNKKHTSDNAVEQEEEINPGVVDVDSKNADNPPIENKTKAEMKGDSKNIQPAKPVEDQNPTVIKQNIPDQNEPIPLNKKWDTEELATNIKINTDIITPNGDNLNDEFTLEISNAKICNLIIYDRNGKVVIQYNTQTASWNGKLKNGNDAADGTYFYFIFGESLDGRPFDKKGNLTIKK
jgi:gliding motility-associated-like protein